MGEGLGVAWWEVRGSRTVGGEHIFWGFFVFLPCVGLPKVIYCAARWSSPIDTANCDVDCGLTPNGTEVHAAQFSWGSVDRRKLISNDWRERDCQLSCWLCRFANWSRRGVSCEKGLRGSQREEGIALHTCVMRVKMSRCCNYKQLFCYAGFEQTTTTTDCKCNIIIISGRIRILLFSSTPSATFCCLHSLIINLINKKNDKKWQSKKRVCGRVCWISLGDTFFSRRKRVYCISQGNSFYFTRMQAFKTPSPIAFASRVSVRFSIDKP